MRKTLSCCIVVRNEAKFIGICLEHITVLADQVVIVDTGSTDGTVKAIRGWMADYANRKKINPAAMDKWVIIAEVGKQFHDSDGDFDFGAAKSFAFSKATKDYVMWLDARDLVQEQIIVKRKFLEFAEKKECIFTMPTLMSGKHSFNRLRIGPREKCTVIGRIHEYMWVKDLTGISRVQINVPIKNDKPARDLGRNLRLLRKEWDREPTSRLAFYLGNTYHGMQDFAEAIIWFRKRVYNFDYSDEHQEEYYKSLECIAECTLKIYKTKTEVPVLLADVYDVSNEMIRREPLRVEGYYYLGMYHIEKQEFKEAMEALRKHTTCRVPKDVKLWLDPAIYGGNLLTRAIEMCKTAEKYDEVIIPKPEQIMDYNPGHSSSYSRGDQQYRNPSQTVF